MREPYPEPVCGIRSHALSIFTASPLLHRDRSQSASRSVALRAEIGPLPPRDRSYFVPRSVRFRIEIGRTPRRDRSASATRSVVLRAEIGPLPPRDRSHSPNCRRRTDLTRRAAAVVGHAGRSMNSTSSSRADAISRFSRVHIREPAVLRTDASRWASTAERPFPHSRRFSTNQRTSPSPTGRSLLISSSAPGNSRRFVLFKDGGEYRFSLMKVIDPDVGVDEDHTCAFRWRGAAWA